MPKKADEFIVKMFLTPLNFKIPEAETTFKIQANLGSYKFKGEELMTFQWGNPNGKTVFFIHGCFIVKSHNMSPEFPTAMFCK